MAKFERFITDRVHSDAILEMLHVFIEGQTPHNAALIIQCALDLRLIYPMSASIIQEEFPEIGSTHWHRTLMRTGFTDADLNLTSEHMRNYLDHLINDSGFHLRTPARR